jgi:hypothetical protein
VPCVHVTNYDLTVKFIEQRKIDIVLFLEWLTVTAQKLLLSVSQDKDSNVDLRGPDLHTKDDDYKE